MTQPVKPITTIDVCEDVRSIAEENDIEINESQVEDVARHVVAKFDWEEYNNFIKGYIDIVTHKQNNEVDL